MVDFWSPVRCNFRRFVVVSVPTIRSAPLAMVGTCIRLHRRRRLGISYVASPDNWKSPIENLQRLNDSLCRTFGSKEGHCETLSPKERVLVPAPGEDLPCTLLASPLVVRVVVRDDDRIAPT